MKRICEEWISEAAKAAAAGDEVLVAPGIYREEVSPIMAGTRKIMRRPGIRILPLSPGIHATPRTERKRFSMRNSLSAARKK